MNKFNLYPPETISKAESLTPTIGADLSAISTKVKSVPQGHPSVQVALRPSIKLFCNLSTFDLLQGEYEVLDVLVITEKMSKSSQKDVITTPRNAAYLSVTRFLKALICEMTLRRNLTAVLLVISVVAKS